MPEVGETRAQGDELCAIESCKAAASVYAPMGGKVTAVNEAIEDAPELVNSDPYGAGWLCKIELDDAAAPQGLMDAEQYAKFLEEEEED